MLENTLGLFTIFSIYFLCASLINKKRIFLLIGSLLVFFAFLTKGPIGLFPLILVLIYYFVYNTISFKSVVSLSSTIILIYVLCTLVVIVPIPSAIENLRSYFTMQVFSSIQGQRETSTTNHLYILYKLFLELVIPFGIILLLYIRNYSLKRTFLKLSKTSVFFFLIGLSASLPLMITLKQKSYYLVPSIPFFAIGFGLIISKYLNENFCKMDFKYYNQFKWMSIVLLISVLAVSSQYIGKYSRDKEKLHDVYIITQYISKGNILGASYNLCSDWMLIAYLNRFGYISLDCKNKHEYFLTQKYTDMASLKLENYEELNLNLELYKVYQKK